MTTEQTNPDQDTRRDGSALSEGLGPLQAEAKAQAFAEALRGIADGLDQRRWWCRPDALVMSTLRRAADELEKAGKAAAEERERCARLVETMDTTGHDGYIETTADLCDAIAARIRRA
jgi:polyphosphate kinase 2 (PPK2 family)